MILIGIILDLLIITGGMILMVTTIGATEIDGGIIIGDTILIGTHIIITMLGDGIMVCTIPITVIGRHIDITTIVTGITETPITEEEQRTIIRTDEVM